MLHASCFMRSGQALILGLVFVAVLLTLSVTLVNANLQSHKASVEHDLYLGARAIAEAGIEKTLWCLGQTSGENCGGTFGSNYVGEALVPFGAGVFTTTVSSILSSRKEITSTGFITSGINPRKKITLKATVGISSEVVNFHFGMQADRGGMDIGENSEITGNVISAGSIRGATGARVSGDVLIANSGPEKVDQAWSSENSEFRFASTDGREDIAQRFVPQESNIIGKVVVKLRKVSNPNDIALYIVRDVGGAPDINKIGEGLITASSLGTSLALVTSTLSSPAPVAGGKPYWLILDASSSATKNYYAALDSSNGYASGTARFSDDWATSPWTDAGGDIVFEIMSGGTDSKIDTLTVGGDAQASIFRNGTVGRDLKIKKTITDATVGRDAYAASIHHSTIGRDAYANSITNSTVGGSRNPGNGIDPPPREPFPVTDSMVNSWKSDAAAGGTHNGNFETIQNQSVTLGPKIINGNMNLANGTELILNGTIHVVGNITVGNGVSARLAPGYGATSGLLVTDGTIDLGENDVFAGSGQAGSYLMMISTATGGGRHDSAIDVHKSTQNIVLVAPYGKIHLHQNVSSKQVTGFSIVTQNNGIISYETGLLNASFSQGPGGGWQIEKGSWREIP